MSMPNDAVYVFTEGFDKYGYEGLNIGTNQLGQLMTRGEWNTYSFGGTPTLAPPIGGTGCSFRFGGNNLEKIFPTGYRRLIGGYAFRKDGASALHKVYFLDLAGNGQAEITVNGSGQIIVGCGGQVVTAVETLSIGLDYFFEYDYYCDNSAGHFNLWLNGVPTSVAITGDTQSSGSSNALGRMGLLVTAGSFGEVASWDHIYVWGYTNNSSSDTPALTNPLIETSYAVADNSVDFTIGEGILGNMIDKPSSGSNLSANRLYLRKYETPVDADITTVVSQPNATSGTAKFKAVVYADNGSGTAPTTRLDVGPEVVGCTDGVLLELPLTTPVAITTGDTLWVGYIVDTAVRQYVMDSLNRGFEATNTYTSGAPNPAPAMTPIASIMIWAKLDNISANFNQNIKQMAALDGVSFNYSTAVGDEDLLQFANLVSTPVEVYSVAIKAQLSKTDSGPRTADIELKSGAVVDTGSDPNQSVNTTKSTHASYWTRNPDGDIDWTGLSVNASFGGVKLIA